METDFQGMYRLLESVFTKKSVEIVPTEATFPYYLVLRFISFYHPSMCRFIDKALNDTNKSEQLLDPELLYKTLMAIIPKMPFGKISYVRRKSSDRINKAKLKEKDFEEKVKQIANYLEISRREVVLYSTLINNGK